MQQFSLIIPTLNEAGNITPLLQCLEDVMRRHNLLPEVIFVDDGSDDGTRQRIEAYRGSLNVHLIRRDTSKGLTGAVVAGANAANHAIIVVMDADLSHPPEIIPQLIAPLEKGECDVTIGSRYIKGGNTPGWSRYRKIASMVASLPAKSLTGVCDPLAGFFAVHKERIMAVEKDLSGFKILLEILAGEDNTLKVREIPISFQDRQAGNSKMNYLVLKKYLMQLIRLGAGKISCRWELQQLLLILLLGILNVSISRLFTNLGYTQTPSRFASMLFTAHFGYFVLPLINKNRSNHLTVKNYLNFFTVTFLGLFLLDGILALPTFSTSGASTIVNFIGTTGILATALELSKRDLFQRQEQPVNWKWFGAGIIVYTILIRLVYLGNIELLQEEAYYWNYSQHMAPGYLDHPPMVALLIRLGTMMFGNNEFGVRFFTFLCWFITAFFSYRLAAEIFEKATAFRAVILIAVLPVFFGTGIVSTPDAPLIACWAGTLYYLYRALVSSHANAWYGVGIFFGLGLASKYTIALLGPAIVIFMLLDSTSRKYFLRPQPYLAALLALSIFSPVIWWNFQNDWASFLFQSQGRLDAPSEFSTHELLASILVLITPTGLIAVYAVCRPHFFRNKIFDKAHINFNRGYLFSLTMLIVPLSIFTLISITKEIKLNWTGPLWLSVIPLLAWAMVRQTSKVERAVAAIWPQTLVLLLLGYGALLHYSAIGLPGVPYRDTAFLFGWDDLAQQVNEQVQEIAEKQGKTPLVAGMDHYRIASGLAFYRNKQLSDKNIPLSVDETTGYQLFGHEALMYEYWHPPTMANNRDILIISHKKEWLADRAFTNRYQQLGNINDIVIKKEGKPVGRYYYRLLSGYSPDKSQENITTTLSDQNLLDGRENLAMTEATESRLL